MKKELEIEIMERYSIINEKNKREIVLLRGQGCSWRRCRFCDYHLDFSRDKEENITLNQKELSKITGIHQKLEVINSGSFTELPEETMDLIETICIEKKIKEVHFEAHYNQRKFIPALRQRFSKNNISVIIKIGVETFDYLFRESYLVKGIQTDNPSEIATYFDECCLLQGIPGQTKDSMIQDIEIGLTYFNRVCINIMQENGMAIKPDPSVIELFVKEIYPLYKENQRVDILLENTAFGVGGVTTNV
ncbi:radical SAM protein [Tannockella kyphosi]|uniref:radical SAM protein n=1 Tax=Tannockella kyphosi TaxID=2899121 RepID=UPI00201213F8|nr:radical SAM protein [Tannockella kyphosi]